MGEKQLLYSDDRCRKQFLDFRDSKFDRLLNENTILLVVAILSREALFIDTANMDGVSVVPIHHHAVYKMPVRTILGMDELLLSFDQMLGTLATMIRFLSGPAVAFNFL